MTIITTDKPLRPRQDKDFYPTQPELARAALKLLPPNLAVSRILDPGCGMGVWGKEAHQFYPWAHICGVDLEQRAQLTPDYSQFIQGDFLQADIPGHYDLVIGNPPYKYAEEFVRRSWDLLNLEGYVVFLLRLSFLASKKRAYGLYIDRKPEAVYVLATRPSFTGDGRSDDNEYALFVWRKVNNTSQYTPTYWYDWKGNALCG